MIASEILTGVSAYYTGKLHEFGATHRGVDWNSASTQQTRFDQVLRLCERSEGMTLGDYGCGYGGLYEYVKQLKRACWYRGCDISESMLQAARKQHAGDDRAQFAGDDEFLRGCDYIVASGIFNVKLQTAVEDWEKYFHRTVDRFNELCTRGFAFNALTSYSDLDRRRNDLYYADPCYWFDYCKRHYARNVALLHDYGLYEFTILVRKPEDRVSQ